MTTIVYTDGSQFPTPVGGMGVAAFTVYDADGALLEQRTMNPFPAENPTIAEMIGILGAIDWLVEHDHTEAVIRTDALPVVLALQNDTDFPGPTRPHWRAIRRWIGCFERLEIAFVPRETLEIQVCDRLCWLGRRQLRDRVVAASAPGVPA